MLTKQKNTGRKALRRTALALALSFTTLFSSSVLGDTTTPFVKVNGFMYTLSSKQEGENGQIIASIYEITNMLGARLKWVETNKTASIIKNDHTLTVTVSKTAADLDGEAFELSTAPVIIKDIFLVPLESVCEALGAQLGVDDSNGAMLIETGEQALHLLDRDSLTDPDAIVITYNSAVQKAVQTNSNIKTLSYNLEIWEDQQKIVRNDMIQAWSNPLSATSYDAYKSVMTGVTSLMRGELAYKNQISNYEMNEKILKEASEYMVRNYVSNIAGYEMDIALLTESLGLSEQNLNNMQVKLDLGLVSENEIRQERQNHEQNLINLENLKILLANEKQALNQLMGYQAGENIAVEFTPEIKTVTVNLDGYVSDAKRNDPTIKMAEKTVEEAVYAVNTHSSLLDESKIEKDNNVLIARENLESTRRNLETSIRSTYNTIQQLSENRRSLEVDLEKARDNYNTLVVNYETGLVTLFDVNQVKLAILQAEIALQKSDFNYSNLVFAFERPYLLTMGS